MVYLFKLKEHRLNPNKFEESKEHEIPMKITDERYSPGAFDLCTAYEHIHRYLFALPFTKGKKVLDLASGEGYGSSLLAQSASEVIGVDLDREAVSHASRVYPNKNLTFVVGSMEKVPLDELFDVIVCFEAMEHIENHELLCFEIKRLLKPGGVFILSTPNKWVYSENGITVNPYHVKELDLKELQTLLGKYFNHHYFYGQKAVTSSRIFPLDSASKKIEEKRIKMGLNGFQTTTDEDPMPRYFIAIGSDKPIETFDGVSYLVDVESRKGFAQWVEPNTTVKWYQKIRRFLRLGRYRAVLCRRWQEFYCHYLQEEEEQLLDRRLKKQRRILRGKRVDL
jgi:2-polyprenyl-3-methyl-5-hydroxy-6-metoxy-1,4-benzoquinol methylase